MQGNIVLSMTPDMKLDKQIRKANFRAINEIDALIRDLQNTCMDPDDPLIIQARKARYIINLVNEMVDSAAQGIPRPWSEFSPRIDEEFST